MTRHHSSRKHLRLGMCRGLLLVVAVWLPHMTFAIPQNSIFFSNERIREWRDANGSKITATLSAISKSLDKVYLTTSVASPALEINSAYISKIDLNYIQGQLARNKYILYNSEYHRVLGYLNDDYICLDDTGNYRLVISSRDLDEKSKVMLSKQVERGYYRLASYNKDVIDKTRLYLERTNKDTDITEVIGTSEGGVIACRVTHFGDKSDEWSFDFKSKAFVKYNGKENTSYKIGEKAPQYRHWFVGFCYRTLNGKRDKFACYVPNIEEATILSVGYVERHYKEPLFLREAQSSKNLDVLSDINHKVAIITSKHGQGSGFILEDGFKTWLYTNEHVARMGKDIKVIALDGKEYPVASTVQIATNRDLFRYEILSGCYFRSRSLDNLTIGDSVIVYGNSDGGGVSTRLLGKILGIGPTRIEVDAPFVKGNSGGPIVSVKDDIVVAVATMAELHRDPDDITKIGTRFNHVRRYGERVENIDWDVVSWECYSAYAEKLESYEYLWENISETCSKKILQEELDIKRLKVIGNYRLEKALRKLYEGDKAMLKYLREEKASGNPSYRKWYYDRFKACKVECCQCRLNVLDAMAASLKGRVWATPRLELRAKQLAETIDLAVRKFKDEYEDILTVR